MRLRVHICNNDSDADKLIEFLKSDPDFEGKNLRKMSVPDLNVQGHGENLTEPKLLNFLKVSVVYEDAPLIRNNP